MRELQYPNPAVSEDLIRRVARVEGVSETTAKSWFVEMLKFLHLSAASVEDPRSYAPSPMVDIAWHAFILYTADYAHYCESLCGRFLHHRPTVENVHMTEWESAGSESVYAATRRAIRDHFGDIDIEVWPPELEPELMRRSLNERGYAVVDMVLSDADVESLQKEAGYWVTKAHPSERGASNDPPQLRALTGRSSVMRVMSTIADGIVIPAQCYYSSPTRCLSRFDRSASEGEVGALLLLPCNHTTSDVDITVGDAALRGFGQGDGLILSTKNAPKVQIHGNETVFAVCEFVPLWD